MSCACAAASSPFTCLPVLPLPHRVATPPPDPSPPPLVSTTQVDDDTWAEVRNWQKCLINMFLAQGKQVIFLETAMGVGSHRHHAMMEAVPVDEEVRLLKGVGGEPGGGGEEADGWTGKQSGWVLSLVGRCLHTANICAAVHHCIEAPTPTLQLVVTTSTNPLLRLTDCCSPPSGVLQGSAVLQEGYGGG